VTRDPESAMAAEPRPGSAEAAARRVAKVVPIRTRRRALALGLAAALGAAAVGLMALSFYWADDLADWRLPGLAALAAIACNVALMIAARSRR